MSHSTPKLFQSDCRQFGGSIPAVIKVHSLQSSLYWQSTLQMMLLLLVTIFLSTEPLISSTPNDPEKGMHSYTENDLNCQRTFNCLYCNQMNMFQNLIKLAQLFDFKVQLTHPKRVCIFLLHELNLHSDTFLNTVTERKQESILVKQNDTIACLHSSNMSFFP